MIKKLPDELAEAVQLPKSQRSIIVGHFLGVDHIGHRFGIEHPEMRRKVADMVRLQASYAHCPHCSMPVVMRASNVRVKAATCLLS